MTTHSKIGSMRKTVDTLKQEPSTELSVTDIKRGNYIPWAKHHRTIVGIIEADMHGPNLLEARLTGKDQLTRYFVSKKNLIKYINTYGPALMSMVRKPNKTNGKSKLGARKRR